MSTSPLLTEHNIRVLLVDDQRIVGEAIRMMLKDIPELEYRFCAKPEEALDIANEFAPTVILQDLVMPGADGIDMVKAFRASPKTASTPLIVLSSKEEAGIKAEAFAAGANDYLVKLPDKLEIIARIRYHSAAFISKLERDEAFAKLEAQNKLIAREIEEAASYVRSLLPAPITEAGGVRSDWRFITSSQLGGDSFGYHWLAPDTLAIYLLDVCGHGTGSALLSVSAINAIRSGSLPGVDFSSPAQVLSGLNRAFPMEEQNGKYFTMWYGVFNKNTRELVHADGGHPSAALIGTDGSITELGPTGMMVGAFSFAQYEEKRMTVPQGSKLFVFSDGCFEVTAGDGSMMTLAEFHDITAKRAREPEALDAIIHDVRAYQEGREEFEDDVSLLALEL